jgi:hypothetical protein
MPYTPPPDWTEFRKLQRDKDAVAAVDRAISIKRRIAELDQELKQLKDDVIEPWLMAGVGQNVTVRYENALVAVRHSKGSKRLNRDKLIQAGVSVKVLDKCSTQDKDKHYVELELDKPKQGSRSRGQAHEDAMERVQ